MKYLQRVEELKKQITEAEDNYKAAKNDLMVAQENYKSVGEKIKEIDPRFEEILLE